MKANLSRKSGRAKVMPMMTAFLSTLLALPSASGASFPDYPLQTGASQVAPNILFILDDSGSMAFPSMPVDNTNLKDNPTDRSFLNNTIYYDPSIDYDPWVNENGTHWPEPTGVTSVYSSATHASGNTISLVDSNESIFYVPKAGVTASTNPSDFVRYWIRNNGGAPQVVRASSTNTVLQTWSWTQNINEADWVYQGINVPAGASQLVISISGNTNNRGNADLYVRSGTTNPTTSRYDYRNIGSGSSESVTINNPQSGDWRIGVYNSDSGSGDRTVRGNTLTVTAYSNAEPATPTGRSQADELHNIATWYTYHRTRMKVAKAGASEAFSRLGSNVRVGFRTIWNRNNFDIPVTDGNSGLFEDRNGSTSRARWFARLFDAVASGRTPLHAALDGAGRYFQGDSSTGPYGPESGTNQYQCRQNFTILTTDGYWNSKAETVVGEQDNANGQAILNPLDNTNTVRYTAAAPYQSSNSDTLADVAMKYWKTDLRTDLSNIVPTSDANPAFWQHMVTFGVSIGLEGSVDETSVAQVIRDSKAGGAPRINGQVVAWPNPNDNEDVERIDDLLHAAVNGHGEFIVARNGEAFGTALFNVLGKIQERLASGSNVATNSTSFQSDVAMYQATYMSQSWTGDLKSREITAAGGISSEVQWSVADRIAADSEYMNRPVLTWDATRGRSFPTAGQEAALARTAGVDGSTITIEGADNAAYIKGDRSQELIAENGLRRRDGLLGDIVNSSPFYVGDSIPKAIYIGANDGMLHGINAETGDVMFSYVPAGVDMEALSSLSDPTYTHRFFVDGPITVSSHAAVAGKNYLVGTLGRGGKGVFALDVSNPESFSANDVMWDHTTTESGSADNDMGFVTGSPLIAKGNNDRLLAFVSNGIDSASGSATLFVYDVLTGDQVGKITADASGDNGLSAPRGADVNGDGKLDFVYAGDLKGNVWKFDFSTSSNPADAAVAYKLFQAVDDSGNPQPITGGLALAREPVSRRIWVTFGTGRLFTVTDLGTVDTQSLYGLIDTGSPITVRTQLTERMIAAVSDDGTKRAFETYSTLPSGSRGWYVNLGIPSPEAAGERVVSGPRIDGRALWVSSVIPTAGDGCESGGGGYLNSLDAFTGTQPSDGAEGTTSFIDLDGDGVGDTMSGDDGNTRHVGSVDVGVGMPTESRQVDELVLICGSNGTCASLGTPPSPGAPKRLGWRELFTR